jgi:hypothetical protein
LLAWGKAAIYQQSCPTDASLCVNAGIKPIDIAAMMGHRNVKTTLTVYAHLINTDDNMAALGAFGGSGIRRQRDPGARLEGHGAT